MKRKSACLILMVMVYCMCQLSVFASENTGVLLLTPEEAQAKYEMLLEQGVIKEYTPTIMPASTIVDRNRYLVYSVGAGKVYRRGASADSYAGDRGDVYDPE